jgi:hypothetical protein
VRYLNVFYFNILTQNGKKREQLDAALSKKKNQNSTVIIPDRDWTEEELQVVQSLHSSPFHLFFDASPSSLSLFSLPFSSLLLRYHPFNSLFSSLLFTSPKLSQYSLFISPLFSSPFLYFPSYLHFSSLCCLTFFSDLGNSSEEIPCRRC